MKFLRLFFAFAVLALIAGMFAAPARAQTPTVADVTLSWQHDAIATVKEFRVYELKGEAWTLIHTVAPVPPATTPALEHKLLGLTPGIYTYRVTAANLWGESGPTNAVSTPPPAIAPKGLTVEVVLRATVTVTVPQAPQP